MLPERVVTQGHAVVPLPRICAMQRTVLYRARVPLNGTC